MRVALLSYNAQVHNAVGNHIAELVRKGDRDIGDGVAAIIDRAIRIMIVVDSAGDRYGGNGGAARSRREIVADVLMVDFAKSIGATVVIRGLRAVSDFEYEFQMAAMNQRLNMEIETVVLMADPRMQAIASRLVKEIAMLGGDVKPFTSPYVADLLVKRFKELNK